MTKEKLASLTKYVNDLKSKLSSPIPSKHAESPKGYLNFLKFEIERTQATIDAGKENVSKG